MPRTPTELHFAIINEEIDTAKQLINNGATAHAATTTTYAPLFTSSTAGYKYIDITQYQ